MKNYVNTAGLKQVLQSIDQKIASESKSLFNTDEAWEAASLTVLNSWVSGTTATDTINGRVIQNFDVYLVTDTGMQYYFDSGTWVSFTPDLTNYYTKQEADARYPTIAHLQEQIAAVTTTPLTAEQINTILTEVGFPEVI